MHNEGSSHEEELREVCWVKNWNRMYNVGKPKRNGRRKWENTGDVANLIDCFRLVWAPIDNMAALVWVWAVMREIRCWH